MKSIYLDVCSLCRPFDDQTYLRIRMETEAVSLILTKVRKGRCKMYVSPVHFKEIDAIKESEERLELKVLLEEHGESSKVDLNKDRERAEELVELGFGIADAAHVAFAEANNAEFITCDDKLAKKCKNHKIKVWSGGPLSFCEKEGLR